VVLTVDVRGQRGGASDNAVYPGPRTAGYMTAGIEDPNTYYYRHVFLDAVRAVDVLAGREEVDPNRLAVYGLSQGGALALATAALEPRVALCMSEVPFLCDFARAVSICGTNPYQEIAQYCRPLLEEQVNRIFRTLISVGLCDTICPPSGIFGVYNHLTCDKRIEIYPYMGHEASTDFLELCMREMAGQFEM
jgi:cephalosporin-C deacetylase